MFPPPLQAGRRAVERAGKLEHTEQERALALQQLRWAQHPALPRTAFTAAPHTLSSSSALHVRKESMKRVNELHLLSVSLRGKGNPLAPGGNLPLSFELRLLLSGAAPVSVFLTNSASVSFFCTDIRYAVHKLR